MKYSQAHLIDVTHLGGQGRPWKESKLPHSIDEFICSQGDTHYHAIHAFDNGLGLSVISSSPDHALCGLISPGYELALILEDQFGGLMFNSQPRWQNWSLNFNYTARGLDESQVAKFIERVSACKLPLGEAFANLPVGINLSSIKTSHIQMIGLGLHGASEWGYEKQAFGH